MPVEKEKLDSVVPRGKEYSDQRLGCRSPLPVILWDDGNGHAVSSSYADLDVLLSFIKYTMLASYV